MNRDKIYSLPRQHVGDFQFDESVVEVFPDMIARSVPGYASILSMIEQLSVRFIQPGSNIYDLGCSLGAATMLMKQHAPQDCRIRAVDNSAAMVRRVRELLSGDDEVDSCPVTVHQEDIASLAMEDASFVVLNFTLQFVLAARREEVLQKIFQATRPGGALLLSEKICFEDEGHQALLSDLHHDFKRANGYSDLEISQKRTALENQLIPETLANHVARLRKVGYQTVAPWFQCFNFVSILAVKSKASV